MRCHPLVSLVAILVLTASAAHADADNGARPGSELGGPAPLPVYIEGTPDLAEGFDDIMVLPGWFMQNNSDGPGTTNWFQGNDAVFPAHAGAATAYIAANFNNAAGSGTVSNWLLTPELNLPIEEACFFTQSISSTFPDRLEVRLSTNGASTDVGTLSGDIGDFTDLLIEINPTQSVGGYPDVWTQFCTGQVAGSGTGRLAFHYFVTNSGPSGSNGDYIGIDTFEYTEGTTGAPVVGVPVLNAWGLSLLVLLLGGAAVFFIARR